MGLPVPAAATLSGIGCGCGRALRCVDNRAAWFPGRNATEPGSGHCGAIRHPVIDGETDIAYINGMETARPARKALRFTAGQWEMVRAFRFDRKTGTGADAVRRLNDPGLKAAE